jgi:hypothetical protein
MNEPAATGAERRRARRIRVRLRGRFLLSDGGEHPCETRDVSATGVSVGSPMIPNLGERIVAYLDEIGRLEGVVVRRSPSQFALSLKTPGNRMDRLAQKLAALDGAAQETCRADAPAATRRPAELRVEFGPTYPVEARAEPDCGARIFASLALLPGVRVALDGRPGVVLRAMDDGFLVGFDRRGAG